MLSYLRFAMRCMAMLSVPAAVAPKFLQRWLKVVSELRKQLKAHVDFLSCALYNFNRNIRCSKNMIKATNIKLRAIFLRNEDYSYKAHKSI